jgi:hypothetical protein
VHAIVPFSRPGSLTNDLPAVPLSGPPAPSYPRRYKAGEEIEHGKTPPLSAWGAPSILGQRLPFSRPNEALRVRVEPVAAGEQQGCSHPDEARSRIPAAAVWAISGSPEEAATKTTPAITTIPVQRGSTPARITARPKGQAPKHHQGTVDHHPRTQTINEGVPVGCVVHQSEHHRACEITVPVKKMKAYEYTIARRDRAARSGDAAPRTAR